MNYSLLCAWCKAVIGPARVENSHGMCNACYRRMMGLPEMSLEQLDHLPFGVIALDRDGIILAYNRAEERLSLRRAADLIGKNFFREVAPCTYVEEFYGRFQRFLKSNHALTRFNFIFNFKRNPEQVHITLVRVSYHQGAAIIIMKRSDEKS